MTSVTASFTAMQLAPRSSSSCFIRDLVGASTSAWSEARQGPGWFDSSWDLQRGLEVCEDLPADPCLRRSIELHMAIERCLHA